MPRLIPQFHFNPFSGLAQAIQDELTLRFLTKWRFRLPQYRGNARRMQQGEWVPIQTSRGDRGQEEPLGDGGLGIVHLWCCVDADNQRRNPLAGKPITYRIGSYKLYFEYCPHGDLHTQITAQNKEERRYRVSKVRSPGGHAHARRKVQIIRDVPFHEGFVWRMFEALAKCAVAMERANVLHGDLCPTNIFLGESDPNRFKIWPIPKLSDFGSSQHIDLMTRNRFGDFENGMQVSFTPPELARPGGVYEVSGMKITHKTNVWQIGMVIACMMRLDVYLPETDWRTMDSHVPADTELHFDDPDRRELKDNLFQHPNCHYSAELIGLVKDGMRFHQIRRPTPQRLLARVQELMQGRCGGMETYTGNANGKIPWNKKEKLRDLQPDQWQEIDPVFVV